MRSLSGRLTYANVVSTLSLFLVLTGGAVYAADKIGSGDIAKNAVKSKHIKAAQVKSADIAADAIGGSHVVDNSIEGADVDEASLVLGGPTGVAGGDLAGTYPNPTIRQNVVGPDEVAQDILTANELANNSVNSNEIATDSVRADEIVGLVNRTVSIEVPATSSRALHPVCIGNEIPVSGGLTWSGADDSFVNLWALQSAPDFTGDGWLVRGANPGAGPRTMTAYVRCTQE